MRTLAGQATPTIDDVPRPDECRIAPRDTLALVELTGTPAAGELIPERQRARKGDAPAGQPAPPAVAAGIAATVRELAACANAGDQARALALYSDDYFRRLITSGGGFTPEYAEFLATPQPIAAEKWIAAPAVSGARLLDDGRSGAFVATGVAEKIPFFLFALVGERWLIDEIIEPA
jgi:hypothetical protein